MYKEFFDSGEFLMQSDPEVGAAINLELGRLRDGIELIASENTVSPAVLAAAGSILTNKYAEGYPGKRYYGGCVNIDIVESLAIERAKKLFSAEHVNVQPHCGANANTAVYFAFLQPGDTVLGLSLSHGGHLSHGLPINISGKYYNFIPYEVDDTGFIDYDALAKLADEHKPRMIVAGASAYPRTIDFKKFREIADSCGAMLFVDMAHIAGLVAAGVHPSPIPYADIVTTTTHKTLRGPRGGMILCKEEYAKDIDRAVFPGTQGGPLEHIIAAKAVCFKEAASPEFTEYQKAVVNNCAVLAKELMGRGLNLVSGGTDNHLILLSLVGTGCTGKELEHRLDEVGITVNKNTIPNDPEKPFVTSGVRIGTAAVTTRGFGEPQMRKLAELIALTVNEFEAKKDYIIAEVKALCKDFPLYE